jgi:glycine/D-amino acid oxidase-like deaminating enzyme
MQAADARVPLPPRATIAIVGAGSSGLALAATLAPHVDSLVVLEANRTGTAPDPSLGVARLGPVLHVARLAAGHGTEVAAAAIAAAQRNRDLLAALARELPEIALDDRGGIRLAADAGEADELERSAAFLAHCGIATRTGAPDALLPCAPRRAAHAAWHGLDAAIDPERWLDALGTRARTAGATLCFDTRVTRIDDDGDVRLHTPRGVVAAEIAIVAAGAALPVLVPWCRFKIVGLRTQALRGAPAATAWEAPVPWWSASFGFETYRAHTDGSVTTAGSRDLRVEQELGSRAETTPAVQELLERNLAELEPRAPVVVAARTAALQAVPCDGLPIAGAVPGRARLLVLGGFGVNAPGWAHVAAEVVAELVLYGRAAHALPFSPRRFL